MEINKQKLINLLEELKPGLSNKEILEQSNTFGFINNKIVTYNDSISIQAPIDLNLNGAVDALKFYQIINKIKPNKKENIVLELENDQLIIKSKKQKSGLIFQNECKLPLEEINLEGKWKKLPNLFKEVIKLVVTCCSNNYTRPILTCVYIDQNTIKAGDSTRVIKFTINTKFKTEVAIPKQTILHLLKYDITHYMLDENWIHFKTDNIIFSSRIINEKYPNVNHLFDVKGEELEFPDKIIESIEKAEIFSQTDLSDDTLIQIIINDNILTIKSENNLGWFEEKMKIKSNINTTFYTNPKFLINILKTMKKCIITHEEDKERIKFTGDNWEHIIAIDPINKDQ